MSTSFVRSVFVLLLGVVLAGCIDATIPRLPPPDEDGGEKVDTSKAGSAYRGGVAG